MFGETTSGECDGEATDCTFLRECLCWLFMVRLAVCWGLLESGGGLKWNTN